VRIQRVCPPAAPPAELQLLKSKVVKVVVAQNCSKEFKIAVEAMKQFFSHSTVLDLHFDKYSRTKAKKKLKKNTERD
jgi:hypothetical protein